MDRRRRGPEVEIHPLAQRMHGGGLAPDAEQPERASGLLDGRPHRLHESVAAMAMIDHRLARLARRPQVGPLQGVVAHDLAGGRLADDRVEAAIAVEPLDPKNGLVALFQYLSHPDGWLQRESMWLALVLTLLSGWNYLWSGRRLLMAGK